MTTASRFAASLVLVLLASTSRAALVDVGNGLINHPDANITWIADGNLFQTMAAADTGLVTKIIEAWKDGPLPTLAENGATHTIVATDFNTTTGRMNWYGARAWVNYLRVTHYKGYSDWRLPKVGNASLQTSGCTSCVPGDGDFAVNTSEWWRLYYQELGGTAHVPIATSNNGNNALFQNLEGDAFWGDARSGLNTALFRDGGEQTKSPTITVSFRVLAVRDGQSIVNPPAAPYITFLPTDPIFPLTPFDTPNPGNITLRNIGTAAAPITSITATGDFTVTHDCGSSLAMAATCTATVTFRPTDLFTRTGTLTINAGTVFTTSLTGSAGISANISSSEAQVKEGDSVIITWSSSPQSTCVGVGGTPGWAGPLAQSGTREVSSPEAGQVIYAISCTHTGGTLPAVQDTTSVFFKNVASGSLDWSVLFALMFALGLVVRTRTRRD